MKQLTICELQKRIDEIIACNAFELHSFSAGDGEADYYIPYLMNDAMECYLIVTRGRMIGEYVSEGASVIKAELLQQDDSLTGKAAALILHQSGGSVCTLWFSEAFQELRCYRYDRIGHFWVEGQEHWRRLVYIIGTIHDKYSYMGESVCNKTEQELLPLMEFAPFRAFSPIRESLDDYYKDSEKGYQTMVRFAEEAGDTGFLRLLWLYRLPVLGKLCSGLLTEAMKRPQRQNLYRLLFQKVENASSFYPERVYEADQEQKMQQERERISKQLGENGFSGTYPLFWKKENRINTQIFAMEEHPFTILESERFRFRIQLMVSETREERPEDINPGFFQKRGNRGWIIREL